MIPEQALLTLPEALTGAGFPEQSYEGGIVGIYCLSLLQALNGRNIPNPLSCIQMERPFRGRVPWPAPPQGNPRYLRGDIYLNIDQVRIGSVRLGAYGWRFHNWVEAKFFRKSTTNKQKNTGDLLADLLRITALVPDVVKDGKTITGRYMLHVYEAMQPNDYLSINKNTGGGSEPRRWLDPLVNFCSDDCEPILLGDYEAAGILGEINDGLGDVQIEFSATTTLVSPLYDLGEDHKQYTCALSRIDSFKLVRGTTEFEVKADRSVVFTPDEATVMSEIREHIGQLVSTTKKSEETKPTLDEVGDGGVEAGGEADADVCEAEAPVE